MPVFSKIASLSKFGSLLKAPGFANATKNAVRKMSDHERTFPMQPSRFQWHKFKDLLHFYTMLGVLPMSALIFYVNVFIGPATLAEIPEGYVPKHWEFYSHPITRFMARYCYASPQQEYEKMCHMLYEESEKMALRKLEVEIRQKMSDNQDFQAYYYRPALAKYHRVAKKASEELMELQGDN